MSAFYAAIDAVNEDEQVLPDHRLVGVDVAVPEFDALEAHNRGEPGDRLRFCFGPYFILRSRSIAGASPCTWVWSCAVRTYLCSSSFEPGIHESIVLRSKNSLWL